MTQTDTSPAPSQIRAPRLASGDADSGDARAARPNLLARLRDLPVGTRVGLGFGVAFALVVALALVGVASLYGVSRSVGGFSVYADASQAAADLDIGLRDLEVAVRDHLADGDGQSLQDARLRRDGVQDKITTLAGLVGSPADRKAVDEARRALDAYWTGFERLVALRADRARVMDDALEPQVALIRQGLARLKDAGGVDSAALASDATVSVLLMQDHLSRFIDRRDDRDALRMRVELGAARNRLAEMNRYLWVPGTRQTIDEVEATLAGVGGALDRIEKALVEEDALRADTLAPNAAAIAAQAAEVRQRNDAGAAGLRGGLTAEAWRTVKIAAWVGLFVLAAGALLVWVITRSVGRPVGALADAVTALAAGRTDVALPAATGKDEIAAMARAVDVLRANTVEMERLKREAAEMHGQALRDKERAETASQAKTNALVNVGHELHGPLSDIVTASQSLMGELHRLGAGELANDVEQIQWTGEQLVTLVDAILDYAKIEAGTMDVVLQDFDVNRLLVEVRERVMPAADLHGNEVLLRADPALGQMYSDFTKVRQALLNLLDNACKFTQGGTVTLSAERFERDGAQWLRYSVADTGTGFPTAQTGRLFQPFVQGGPAGSTAKRRGAGLGLTLVGHYAAMLGGDIEVASEPGQGTRITLSLPAYYQPSDEERPLQVSTTAGGESKRPLLTIGTLRPMARIAP
ncbi:ATP-binding protein [Azospirillum rugosum]|uniref:histidine kinase n=1 Tax=Azospirillum rugosum TaxID=416170 RepID=A0ABS4SNE8_9PROT|nr:ATP-binding protein [Azospirillum rugosum]MBP2294084.1 signal transduction histidine kinase [Azospirillum rugosum]MDQ0527527.1 signal transduction histidine kinase [Azospirillum rugosum]